MSTQGAHDAAPEPAKPTPEDTPPKVASVGRRYSGMCSADRVLERYARLIEAGIDVFGTQGYASAKIKTLCQRAGLSERYFYESFESREDLLTTVYDHLATAMLDALKSAFKAPAKDLAASVKAGTAGAVHFMLDDPRAGQTRRRRRGTWPGILLINRWLKFGNLPGSQQCPLWAV